MGDPEEQIKQVGGYEVPVELMNHLKCVGCQ
jgi:hypothetical protein